MPGAKAERRRRVFLAARTVFVGDKAQIRDRSVVKRVVSEHKTDFSQHAKDLTENRVVDIVTHLLENGVFESELRAKRNFPELFQVSAARSIQHDISEQEAARSKEGAPEEALQLAPTLSEDGPGPAETRANSFDTLPTCENETSKGKEPTSAQTSNPSSLNPTYISYPIQHLLLNEAQRFLEVCCFEFVSRWAPDILVKRRWSCPEAVELHQWAAILSTRFNKLVDAAYEYQSGDVLAAAIKSTYPMRHAAVHRIPTSATGIEQMLQDSLKLVQALNNTCAAHKLENLLLDFRAKVRDIELHKNHFENDLDSELRNIREERAALDLREKRAKETVIEENRRTTERISLLLKPSIAALRDSTDATLGARSGNEDFEKQRDDAIEKIVEISEEDLGCWHAYVAAESCSANDLGDI